MEPIQQQAEDPVAVVGFSFRFPQDAVSEDAFWNIIQNGLNTMTELPKSRYNINGYHSTIPGRQDTVSARGGHFIKGDIAAFDAPFFKMSSAEAKAMDPQLRLLLETTYHAFESSGITLDQVQGSNTSVYVGNIVQEYGTMFVFDNEINPQYQATGLSSTMLSNRLSWFYDMRGPSVSIDTACSSGLVGIHLGCQSILNGEANMSIVGGVQLQLEPMSLTSPISRQGFLSPDGQCYSFDTRANGYSRGEGVGVVVLKRLSKALQDGDMIRAVIRGTSVNQDGRTPSISQPSSTAQAALIKKAYEPLGLDLATTGYFEAHGTGTPVGDPIEAKGIELAFSGRRPLGRPVYVGSVKANIGHLEPSAGLAGLIKVVMMLERDAIPPNALLENLNPKIRAEEWNLKFPTATTSWPTKGLRRASVNSFGYGGTNGHCVVDDALHYLQSRGIRAAHNTISDTDLAKSSSNGALTNGTSQMDKLVFLLCASDEQGIERQMSALENHLQNLHRDFKYLQDLAFTLSNKRSRLPWKTFAIASSAQELQIALTETKQKPTRCVKEPLMLFVFTGQGAQWVSMGKALLRYPAYRDSLAHADTYFRSISSPWSLLEELYEAGSTSRIDDPTLAQPFCTALQVALVDLLASWNILPRAVVGHSSGEIAAAYCAGGLTKDSALLVAYLRGEAVSRQLSDNSGVKGGMLSVGLSENDLAPYIRVVAGRGQSSRLSCGCINSPKSTTVTGDQALIDQLERHLQADSVFVRKINVPIAYHSTQMLAAADFYQDALQGKLSSASKIGETAWPSFYSSVTGKLAPRHDLCQPEYWINNLVSQVKFSTALHLMCSSTRDQHSSATTPSYYLLEVGPHCALQRPIRDTVAGFQDVTYDYCIRRGVCSVETTQQMAGRLAINGHAVDLRAVNYCPREPKMLLGLPPYAFNHSQSYWTESRLSKNNRSRDKPRHELLGTRSADWNPLKPTWRFFIRQSELPWVSDHKIDNTMLYPAAGMLVMVFEGMHDLTEDTREIAGYLLRDVTIANALVVPSDEDGIETQLSMSLHDSAASKDAPVFDFWIHSVAGSEWKLHATGQVSISPGPVTDPVSESQSMETDWRNTESRCSSTIDKMSFYQELYKKGTHFGETFQTLQEIRFNEAGCEATAKLPRGDWPRLVREGLLTRHLIHPSTLDGLIHIVFASVYNEWSRLPQMVPTALSEVYVSRGLLDPSLGDAMKLYGNVTGQGISSLDGNASAVNTDSGQVLAAFKGLQLLGIQTADAGQRTALDPTSLYHQIDWKPDVRLLSQIETEQYCRDWAKDMAEGGSDIETEVICRHFLSEAVVLMASDSTRPPKPHLVKYVEWAANFLEDQRATTLELLNSWPGFGNAESRPRLIDEYSSKSSERRLIVEYGRKLVSVLRGDTEPLELLFNKGLAESLYTSPLVSLTSERLAGYMDLLAHKNSNIRILEVGAGTGGTTTPVLEALSRDGRFTRASHYDFTDISPSFFAGAQDKYAAYSALMSFKTLDIERDPEEQGFEAESYDVVIAGAVLHATSSIGNSLLNVRKLLKRGGHLICWEPTNRQMATFPFVFGVLPGWWLATETYRTSGPLLTKDEWNRAFLDVGFDGLDVALSDGPEDIHGLSLLATHLNEVEVPTTWLSTLIVTETTEQAAVASHLQQSLSDCTILHRSQLQAEGGAYDQCICLMELNRPILAHLTEAQFSSLGHMMGLSNKIIWVTNNWDDNPEAAMVGGLGKTLMRERPGLDFIHLNVESPHEVVKTVLRVVDQSINQSVQTQESDLLESHGQLLVPRVVEASLMNSLADADLYGLEAQPVKVDESRHEPLQLSFSPGRLDSFHFTPSAAASTPLKSDEIRVAVKAAGVNFKDVMVALNQVKDDHIGQEFAGIVTEVGLDVAQTFQPGDRVCGIGSGTFCDYFIARACHLIKIPPTIPFTEASAIPLAYATAQYGLHHLARLQPGETILIHAAAGAVGQAAIQIAQASAATVYVTVSSPEKKKLLMDLYGIDAANVFSSRHLHFAEQIMKATDGKGVDVVLNSLSGQALVEGWRCLAMFGRFVEIGKRDISTFQSLPMEPFQRNVTFSSLDLAVVYRHNDGLIGQVMQEVQRFVFDEKAQRYKTPQPVIVYKRSGLEEAFRLLQTGRHVGKAVIDWEQADTIQVMPKSPLDYRFDGDATYVIAGGLGGIGRNIARWFTSQGARSLVLLSRSGPKTDDAKELVAALEQDGVHVYAPRCDVADPAAVEAAISFARENMAPIKGFINASMVVENRLFENYDLPSFHSAIPSKVQGTINLDKALPEKMDFFVLLSSLSGIHGAASQSNYAAANAFLDAFARSRQARGQTCISLVLGIVEGFGYVAERVSVVQNMAMTYIDHKVVRESDLHFLLKYACNGRLRISSERDTRIIAALTTPASVRRGGMAQDHGWMRPPMFRHLYRMELHQMGSHTAAERKDSAGLQLKAAASMAEAGTIVTQLLAKRLARSLAVPVDDIDINRPPYAFGVDSLVAVELLFWFSNEIHADVPVVQILSSMTIAQLAKAAAEKSDFLAALQSEAGKTEKGRVNGGA